jgi:hypothetical protein
MALADDLEVLWVYPVAVTDHAIERALERLGWGRQGARERIRADVRDALLFGRVALKKPDWTRRGNAVDRDPRGAIYAWDEEATRCWRVLFQAGSIVVLTLVLSSDVEDDERSRAYVRSGMERR